MVVRILFMVLFCFCSFFLSGQVGGRYSNFENTDQATTSFEIEQLSPSANRNLRLTVRDIQGNIVRSPFVNTEWWYLDNRVRTFSDSLSLKNYFPSINPAEDDQVRLAVVDDPLSLWIYKSNVWYEYERLNPQSGGNSLWTDDGDGTISYPGRIDVQDIGVTSVLNKYIINDNGTFGSVSNIPYSDITGLEQYESFWTRDGTTLATKTANDDLQLGPAADLIVDGGLYLSSNKAYGWYHDNSTRIYTRLGEQDMLSYRSISNSGLSMEAKQFSVSTTADTWPAYTFFGDSNTGLYLHGEDEVGLTAGSVGRIIAKGGTSPEIRFRDYGSNRATDGTPNSILWTDGSTGIMQRSDISDIELDGTQISLDASNFDEIGNTYNDVQSSMQRVNDLLGVSGSTTPTGTGIAAVKNGQFQTQGYIDTIGNTIIDMRMPNQEFNTTHYHAISRNLQKGGYLLSRSGMGFWGGQSYYSEDTITMLSDGFLGSFNDFRAINVDATADRIITTFNSGGGQEIWVHNVSNFYITLASTSDGGSFSGKDSTSYLLPPSTSALIRRSSGIEGTTKSRIVAGTGYWDKSDPVEVRPDEIQLSVLAADIPELTSTSISRIQTVIGVPQSSGTTIRSIDGSLPDGYEGIILNQSTSVTPGARVITCTANDSAGTGIKFAPGTDKQILPGRMAKYRYSAFTGFAHFID